MKKLVTYILCLTCITLLFTGCAKPDPAPGTDPTGQTANTQGTQNTTQTQATQSTQPVQTDPPAPTMPEGTPLTADELAWFNDEFFSGVWVNDQPESFYNIRNMYMQQEFASIKEIDLELLFQNGVHPTKEPVTQEELHVLQQATGSAVTSKVIKIPSWDMDMAFLHTTGKTLSQTIKKGLDKLIYLEEYDAYYSIYNDSVNPLYEIKEGVKLQGGATVVLRYQNKQSTTANDWIVTLKPHENTYWFVSNLPTK